jgi:hypothetical protein
LGTPKEYQLLKVRESGAGNEGREHNEGKLKGSSESVTLKYLVSDLYFREEPMHC